VFAPGGPTLGELARQALSSTRRGYDLLAPKFDRTPFRTPDWLLDAVAPELGAPASIARGIDLCCGTGAALRVLRPLCRELVVGVDFSFGMLVEARRRVQAAAPLNPAARAGASPAPTSEGIDGGRSWTAEAPRLLLVQQDVLTSGLTTTFDLAVIFGALGHLRPRDQHAFLAAAYRLLLPGGRLVFVTGPTPPFWAPAFWAAAAFDVTMWVRNVIWRPPFVMYYLSWPLRRTLRLLRETGFDVATRPLSLRGRPLRLRLVMARR
jgi:SAM-dependent methyltransferase